MRLQNLPTLFLLLGLITQAKTAPDAVPDPSPVADPGKRLRTSPIKPIFLEEPANQISPRSKTSRLRCRAEGYPTPTISWLKDGKPMRNIPNVVNVNGELLFYDLRDPNSEGVYQCIARNSAGEIRSRNATLTAAYIKEDFQVIPKDTVAAIGKRVVIKCKGPRGLPDPKISWIKDNRKISTSNGRMKIENGNLVITSAQSADSGSYECVASNIAGKQKSLQIRLAVYKEPEFVVIPQDTTVAAGEDVELQCEASGEPKPRIRWTKKNGDLPTTRVVKIGNGNLRITAVRPEDEGEYICNADHRLTGKTASAKLIVTTKPEFIRRPHDMEVRVGSSVTLSCGATGKPKPSVLWHKGESNMFTGDSYDDGHFVVSPDGDLTIHDVRFSDASTYKCQAFSDAGKNEVAAKLTVTSRESIINPPVILQGPSNMTVAQGTTVELRCTTPSARVPKLTWKKDNTEISPGKKYTLTSSDILQISNIQNSDEGKYTCTATDDYGWSEWDAWITVVAKGSVIPAPTSDVTKVPTIPGTPTRTGFTANTISLQWTPSQPKDATPVNGYRLEYYCTGCSETPTWVKVDEKISTNSFTVANLKSGSGYVFLVRAINSYGMSNPSEVSGTIKTSGESQTGDGELRKKIEQISVKVLGALPLSSTTSSVGIGLEWDSSAKCPVIEGFKIFAQPVSVRNRDPIVETVECYARKTDLINLESRVIYEIRIRPYFKDVIGHPSSIILASPDSEGTDPEIPNLKVDLSTSEDDQPASATFTWTAPTNILPEYIARYTLRCYDKSNAHNPYDVTRHVNSSITSLTLDDLPRGQDFFSYVTFTTSLGEGMTSKKVEFTVEAATVTDEGGISSLMKNPGVLAGIAACIVLIIAIIVGVVLYRRHKRKQKSSGLHVRSFSFTPQTGRRPGMPLDPYSTEYTRGTQFTMNFADQGTKKYDEDGAGNAPGNMYMQRNNVHGGMSAPQSATRNTTVSLNKSNGNIGTSLSPDMSDMRGLNHQTSSFSYVTDQLTSMSSIHPQFSSPNSTKNPAQVMSASDLHLPQHPYQREISENPTLPADEHDNLIDMNTPPDGNIGYVDLPPPPPSPPMSKVSERTNRSRGSSKHSTDRGSNHSSRGRRSRERNRLQAMERVPTDTDTGIDSPQQTPSPPRPADLRGEYLQPAMTSQPRPHVGYPYHGQKQHNSRRRNDGIAVEYNRIGDPHHGYLGGPSEGETESELDGMRHPRNYRPLAPEEVRNSVTASSVSMMNAYDSESDCRSSNGMGSRTSSVESLNMESASQVGVNAPSQHAVAPRSGHSAFVPIHNQGGRYDNGPTRPNFVKPKGQQKHRYNGDHPMVINGHNAHLGAQEQFLNRVNSASSSASSSYHQNTADSGMSAGVGSYGHNSLNSSSSAESGPKGQMSRSKTTGSLSADQPQMETVPPHFASVDRRHIQDNSEYQRPRGRQPVPPPRQPSTTSLGYKPTSKSPQRKNSHDSNLSLPTRDGTSYADYETNDVINDGQPLMADTEYTTNEDDDSRNAFLAAKSVFTGAVGAKTGRGVHPGLSDVPEVSTSDFCEDYSDKSQ